MRRCLLLGAFFIVAIAATARAGEPDYGALDVRARLEALTDEQRARFHIARATWVTDDERVATEHALVLGSLEGLATYAPDGSLNLDGLTEPATSYLLRVPRVWNGRLVAIIPGGAAAHTRFFGFAARLMERGFAVVVMDHPTAGFPGFSWEVFWERPRELAPAYLDCARLVKDLLGEGWARVAVTLFYGGSRGVGRGGGLFVEKRNPFDGFVLWVGGNGRRQRTEDLITALRTDNEIPLTGQPTGWTLPLDEGSVAALADHVGFGDPAYRAHILDALPDLPKAQARALAYRVADRSLEVQRDWADTMFETAIKRPVIVATGTHDQDTWGVHTVRFVQDVIDGGKGELIRFYVVPGANHGPFTDESQLNSVLLLGDWVERGVEPGALVLDESTSIPSHSQAGHAMDAQAYFLAQCGPLCDP
jgi:hypothetical protein